MSASQVYHLVREALDRTIDHTKVDESTLTRLTLLVTGIIGARSASPAAVAQTLAKMGLSDAKPESLERRIRRLENDPEVTTALCFHPFARYHLLLGRPQQLVLIVDATTQEDRLVLLSVSVWYRGRALPLAWAVWPANKPLQGAGFWERVGEVLNEVAKILPYGVEIVVLADRAFGTPAFIDLVIAHGWHFVVRVQGQTRYRDLRGKEGTIGQLVRLRGQRHKLRGMAFKKRGWRSVSVVVYWGRRHKSPLAVVSDLPPRWWLLRLYRQRYPIEAGFRDYKAAGWRWEQGQVKEIEHVKRLLVGMALATWMTLMVGGWRVREYLNAEPTGKRRTPPWEAKYSLFQHGSFTLHQWLFGECPQEFFWYLWELGGWIEHSWRESITSHHARAFVLGGSSKKSKPKFHFFESHLTPVRP